MASRKMKNAKPASARPARPPRQLWIEMTEDGEIVTVETSQRACYPLVSRHNRAVGPFVLAERVREQ